MLSAFVLNSVIFIKNCLKFKPYITKQKAPQKQTNKLIPSQNPLHPIDVDDYPKLFDYVLTADGLKFFYSLRQKYNQGKALNLDEYNKLRLLYVFSCSLSPRAVIRIFNSCNRLDILRFDPSSPPFAGKKPKLRQV